MKKHEREKYKFKAWHNKSKKWHYFDIPYDLFNYNWLGQEKDYGEFFLINKPKKCQNKK